MDWYDHQRIEKKWQERWESEASFRADDFSLKEKAYVLVEFPYPSGDGLHVGHVRSYTAFDVIARKKRMEGKNVLYPMGWDAFGLPTENFAIRTGVHPRTATDQNIATFRRQMKALGLSFDWSREFDTTDPAYYRWTQWIFLQLFGRGLAYQATIPINWCPKDKIGLANEEVVAGRCERCGATVARKMQKQWLLRITAYADRLLKDLETVEYLDKIKTQQVNWIGRSEGAEVVFPVEQSEAAIPVFTTRPDTLYGATYLVLAPEHPLVSAITSAEQAQAVRDYQKGVQKKSDLERTDLSKEKTGVFTGAYAINPVNDEKIPIWIADYVLATYGTGAIMAVPAHDERDWEFAKTFHLPIRQVIAPHVVDTVNPPRPGKNNTERVMLHAIVKHPSKEEFLSLRWKEQPWRTFITGGVEDGEDVIDAGRREIQEETGFQNLRFIGKLPFVINAEFYAAHKDVNRSVHANILLFQLEDLTRLEVSPEEASRHEAEWTPMSEMKNLSPVSELPFILDWFAHGDHAYVGEGRLINSGGLSGSESHKAISVMTTQLEERGQGKAAVQYKLRDWVFSRQHYWGEPIPVIHCPEHGAVPVPEDQLPVELPHVEKYQPTDTGESPLAAMTDWVTTTCPSCGKPAKRETDTMPNWAGSSWYFLRYCDPHNDTVFADRKKLEYWLPVDLYNGGMEHTVLHLLYSRFWYKVLSDLGLVPGAEPYRHRHSHGLVLAEDGRKMSKSWGNVIKPDDLIREYGADSLRLYELFMGPFEEPIPWSTRGIIGVHRFLQGVHDLFDTSKKHVGDMAASEADLDRLRHHTIKRVTEDLEQFHFNTAVSALMEFSNALKKIPRDAKTDLAKKTLLTLLFPMAPHLASELWEQVFGGDISAEIWPTFDAAKLRTDTVELIIQVNGRVRAKLTVPTGIDKAEAERLALADENVQRFLNGKPKKTVFVPNKLVNLVA